MEERSGMSLPPDDGLQCSRGKSLDFECLKNVISISTKFDSYLKDRINEGLDADDLARREGTQVTASLGTQRWNPATS